MRVVENISPIKQAFYTLLCRIRPITLTERLKRILGIRRIYLRLHYGGIHWVDPVSYIGLDLIKEGEFEPEFSQLIRLILREGDTFLDIGANEGLFTVMAALSVGESGTVYAFEPQSRLTKVIKRNTQINDIQTQVHILKIALMEKPGKLKLYLTPDVNPGASSTKKAYQHRTDIEEVKGLPLDAIARKRNLTDIRLAKIDCEGAELDILKGAKQLLQKNSIEFLLVEYHPTFCGEEACDEAHELILQSGYKSLKICWNQNLYYLPKIDQSLLSELKEFISDSEE